MPLFTPLAVVLAVALAAAVYVYVRRERRRAAELELLRERLAELQGWRAKISAAGAAIAEYETARAGGDQLPRQRRHLSEVPPIAALIGLMVGAWGWYRRQPVSTRAGLAVGLATAIAAVVWALLPAPAPPVPPPPDRAVPSPITAPPTITPPSPTPSPPTPPTPTHPSPGGVGAEPTEPPGPGAPTSPPGPGPTTSPPPPDERERVRCLRLRPSPAVNLDRCVERVGELVGEATSA